MSIGLISVIMAAYNAEKTIEAAIRSVLAQTYAELELIVINDGSKDRTGELVRCLAETDPRIRLIDNRQNGGVSFSRKRGAEEARGEWIAVLDSDDMWAADKLEKQTARQRETGAELLFTGSAFMDAGGRPLTGYYLKAPEEIGYRQLLKQNVISNSSALVKKALYLRYYASGDGMHEDFALWLSILKTGRKACGVNEPLLIYRLSAASKSSNKLKAAGMNWNTYRYIGLNIFEAAYYECRYMINGVLKYTRLKRGTQAG